MTRAPAENYFLAVGNKRNAEHNVDKIEPAAWLRVDPEHRCRQYRIDRPSGPATQIVINNRNTGDPQSDFPQGHSESLPSECNSPCGRNSGQHCQPTEPSGVIPENPSSWIVLM